MVLPLISKPKGLAFILVGILVVLLMLGVGKVRSKALQLLQSLKFIENQVGTLHQQGEFDVQQSNFMDITSTIKQLEVENVR